MSGGMKRSKVGRFLLLLKSAICDAEAALGSNLTSIKQLRVKDTNTPRVQIKKKLQLATVLFLTLIKVLPNDRFPNAI